MIDTIISGDGSLTARHKILGDLYHSDRGALAEAQYVYIDNGLRYFFAQNVGKDEVSVFDMGLGTALNAWLTLQAAPDSCHIKYYAIEKYPLSSYEQSLFHYSFEEQYLELLNTPWNMDVQLAENFTIHKIECDVLEFDFSRISPLDVVYWDAFSPDSQPKLWSYELFCRLSGAMSSGGVLTTYSAKGTVKQALRAAGFNLSRLKGALGKRHMLRAVK